MKLLQIFVAIAVIATSISARMHHSTHLRHHDENNNNSTAVQNAPKLPSRNATQPQHSLKLTAINSRPPHVRRRRPGGPRKVARNSTTILQRRNSVYLDIPDFGRDTWRREPEESTSTTTAAPVQTPVVNARGKNYHKNHDGRHVCMQHKTIQVPVKTTEVYTRPTWRHVSEPCHINQICTTLKMFQEPAYRDIIRHQTTKQIVYDCCPGWEQASKSSVGCTKPVCKTKCSNGGRCVKPDFCSCPKGFAGKYCELDINECKEHKPCDQLCYNTEGSYYCKCREGFMLHTDGQSCKKLDGDMNGIEAKDLENEVDNEALIYRLHKVEKMIASDKVAANELHKTVEEATNMIDSLKTRVNNLERKNYEINAIQDKLRNYEAQSRKLENLVSILFKCRSSPNGFCP
ncbi:uncharacterized protein LOC119649870 [Hermetia illucens]|nr:uncharacterized protein LOC119649870 [Hermetia illucens]